MKAHPIIHCGIIATASLFCLQANGQNDQQKPADPWAAAQKSLDQHVAPILKELHHRLDNDEIRFMRHKSELLQQLLPNHRLFAHDGQAYMSGITQAVFLDQKGNITDIEEFNWRGGEGEKRPGMRSPDISSFLKKQKIQINDAKQAIQLTQLVLEIQSASSTMGDVRRVTKNYTVFDGAQVDELLQPNPDWKYTAEKIETGWMVKAHWAGNPKASIMMPPTYYIDLNKDQTFEEIRMVDWRN